MEGNKNVYYIALSGMQKAIRRGLLEPAIKCAYIAHHEFAQLTYKRLWTILFEDCCSNSALILKFNAVRGKYKDFSDIQDLIISLVKAKKTQESVYASWLLESTESVLEAYDCPNLFIALQKTWANLEYDSYNGITLVPPVLVDICQAANGFTREGFNKTAPYIAVCMETAEDTKDDVNLDKHMLIDGFLPSAALDKHTRVGGFATRLYASKNELPFDKTDLDRVLFLNEGMYCKDRLTNTYFMETWYKVMSDGIAWKKCKSKFHEDWFASVYKDINSLRVWALGTIKDDYDYMKKLAAQIKVEYK